MIAAILIRIKHSYFNRFNSNISQFDLCNENYAISGLNRTILLGDQEIPDV